MMLLILVSIFSVTYNCGWNILTVLHFFTVSSLLKETGIWLLAVDTECLTFDVTSVNEWLNISRCPTQMKISVMQSKNWKKVAVKSSIITVFPTNPFIYGWLSKATAFMVTPQIILNVYTFCFW